MSSIRWDYGEDFWLFYWFRVIERLVTLSTAIITRAKLVQIAVFAAYDFSLGCNRAIHRPKVDQDRIVVKE